MFKVTMKVTQEQVSDLLISALEGGSNYWYMLENKNDDASKPYWERAFSEGITISNALADDAGENPVKVLVNRERMQRALELMQREHSRHWGNFIVDNADAETADVFLQLCVFGEVIYG